MDGHRSAELCIVDPKILFEAVQTSHRNGLTIEDVHEAEYPEKRLKRKTYH